MSRVRIQTIKAGARLAEDVKDRVGRVLLAKGTTLGDKQLRILRTWGVALVNIEGQEHEGSEPGQTGEIQVSPEALAEARDAALKLFKHAGTEHPILAQLLEIMTERIARCGVEGMEP